MLCILPTSYPLYPTYLHMSSFACSHSVSWKYVHPIDTHGTGTLFWSDVRNWQLKNVKLSFHLCDLKPKSSRYILYHVKTSFLEQYIRLFDVDTVTSR